MPTVKLVRWISVATISGWFSREIEMPFVVPGMAIQLKERADAERVEDVIFNPRNGLVIAMIEKCEYPSSEFQPPNDDTAKEQFDYETEGWRADHWWHKFEREPTGPATPH
jgi:hypothetical protein